ncbi:MAG TPA: T9SS type B sorting domain-containing protein, partial [Bacteroidetes bacterium]|nr:T9SS type B sorting domain-containing protein [Bacteroidota bacterium]
TSNITCNGGNDGSIEAQSVSGGTPPYQYSLNGGPFQVAAHFPNLGVGTYTIIVRDSNNCLDSLAALQILEPLAISATDSTVTASCQPGMDGEIWVLNVAGGISPYQYNLNGGPFQAANAFTGLNGGNYLVKVRDANNCVLTLSVTVPTPASILATDSLVHITCNGFSDGQIWLNNVSGTPPFLYSLNGGVPQSGNSFTGLASGSYSVRIIDSLGCQLTLNVNLTSPAPVLFSDSLVGISCNGAGDGELWILGTSGGVPPYTYSFGGGAFQVSNGFFGISPGTYSVSVRDSNGCITVSGPIVIGEPQSLMVSDSLVNVNCNGGADGIWYLGNVSGGTSPYEISRDSVNWQSQTSFGGLAAGSHVFYVRDAHGCALRMDALVGEPSALALSGGFVPSTCGNADGAAFVTVAGGSPAYSYLWSNSATTDTASGLASGTYRVTVTDANGCQDSLEVTVEDLLSPTAYIVASSHVACFGDTNGFAVASATGGTGAYSFSWNLPTPVNADSLTNVPPGIYTVTVQDSAGCTDTASVVIGEPAALVLAGTAFNPICPGNADGSASILATGGTLAYDYLWATNPAQTGATANLLAAGSYTATVSDANGCTDSIRFTLTDPVPVTAAFTANPPMPTQLELENAHVIFSNQSQNATTYLWEFGDGGTDSILNPSHTYHNVGNYCVQLIAFDSAACADTTTVCNYQIVLAEFIIPNTFTPNGDGRNDIFEIVGIAQFPNNNLKVFNRWGNLVYEKDKYDNSWNGTNWKNGVSLPDGAYFYIFTTGNKKAGEVPEELMGDIVIFR